jgi:hypothetical protein
MISIVLSLIAVGVSVYAVWNSDNSAKATYLRDLQEKYERFYASMLESKISNDDIYEAMGWTEENCDRQDARKRLLALYNLQCASSVYLGMKFGLMDSVHALDYLNKKKIQFAESDFHRRVLVQDGFEPTFVKFFLANSRVGETVS